MYICICQGITDRQILDAIENGHASSAALAETLGTGTCCGRCQETVETLVQTHAKLKVWQAA